MANPYHGGFTGDDGRDPFGGAMKQRPAKKDTSDEEKMRKFKEMMDKRVDKRRR